MRKFKIGDVVVATGDYDNASLTGCKGKIISDYGGTLVEFDKPFYTVDGGYRLGHDGENDRMDEYLGREGAKLLAEHMKIKRVRPTGPAIRCDVISNWVS